MTRNVTAELLVLRKRAATWILLGIWTVLVIFFAYVIPYARDSEDSPAPGEHRVIGHRGGLSLAGWRAPGRPRP